MTTSTPTSAARSADGEYLLPALAIAHASGALAWLAAGCHARQEWQRMLGGEAMNSDPLLIPDTAAASLAGVSRARCDGWLRCTRQGRPGLYPGRWVLDWLTADTTPASGKGAGNVG
jgi:hypothetical protein